MSKPLEQEILEELNLKVVNKKNNTLLEILNLLEILKSNKNKKMARISGELTELLSNNENFIKIQNANNLNELLQILAEISNKMIKVHNNDFLEERFPVLKKNKFLNY
ncbi:hypothetical protein JG677_00710 [Campylobacter sp. TTU-622]|uniref:hypothetical protein n=1 Tax=unclassified Campylobacter TaxID=2593542 RepID=UPI001908A08E|nr:MULTISPECIES: hypothetical protein [unclassified Campylobacter]MBK1971269.1 hypothetical protein [Campylobacter sp. TTU_617]MBK1972594.1 hypothetical protein [Campylobacter sp. TTU-622]